MGSRRDAPVPGWRGLGRADPLRRGRARRALGPPGQSPGPRHRSAGRSSRVGHRRAHRGHARGAHRRRDVDPGQRILRRRPQVLGLRRHRRPGPGRAALVSVHQRRHRGDSRRRPPRRQGHLGDSAVARGGARSVRPPHVGLRHRARRREPRALRRHPRRLRPRCLEERVRRGDGQEEAEGGVHRARDQGPRGPRPARPDPGRRRDRPRSEDRPVDQHALQLGHAARRLEPLQARRAADQELHDQPHRREHGRVDGA